MAFSTGYTFGFAAVVCVTCSLGIATISQSLSERQRVNAARDLQGNILLALGLPDDGQPLFGERIDKLWAERVKLVIVDPVTGTPVTGSTGDQNGDGKVDMVDVELARAAVRGTNKAPAIISVYGRMDGDKLGAYAVPMFGKGLWGPISGYLALDASGKTVLGTAFSAPKETPGLGAEIMADKFKAQWVGKKVVDGSGDTKAIRAVKGEAKNVCPNELDFCVDGISGATITVRGVNDMVEDALNLYEPYLRQVRGS